MAVTGVQKWPCPTCTYNNWSSSIKCVLCGCSRPNEITLRASVVKYRGSPVQGWSNKLAHSQGSSGACLTQDIICADFNLPQSSALNTMDVHVQPHHHHKVSGHSHGGKCKTKGGKWTCAGCTFSNWPNAGQCTMCGTQRTRGGPKHDPIISAGGRGRGDHQSSRTSSHHSESILNYATSGVGGAVGGAACHAGSLDERAAPSSSSQDALLIQPVAAKSKQNSRNGKRISSQQQQADNINNVKKWKCHQCTYENWPRAVKCIMCQLPRRRTPSPPLSGGEGERDTTQFPPTSVTTPQQQAMSRLASLTTTTAAITHSPSSSSNSSSPIHSRSSSNSNEMLASVSQHRLSPEVSNGSPKAAGGMGGGGGGGGGSGNGGSNGSSRLIGAYERESWGSLEIVPSVQLKSDSDEVRQIRNRLSSSDWLFLNACLGIVNDDASAVRAYLRQEGDRARQLTKEECLVLGQPSTFSAGGTLVHLAIRFQRSEIVSLLLTPASSEARKRLPSQSSPDLASSIREELSLSLIQHKGDWQCYFLTQLTTFTLPADILKFCSAVQKRCLDEIVDRDVEKELNSDAGIINWSSELVEELGSRLYPLWNRTAGDCLLDSVLQATWGVMDREATLRKAMADTLSDGALKFFSRWKEAELRQSHAQGFSLDEEQLRQDWAAVVALADQTGKSLEQIHIFVLSHILRRPILVYGVKVVKNFRGENLGFVNFEGVYLPLLWDSSFCWHTPIALAYTRGHFSALVSMASSQISEAGVWSNRSCDSHVTYLPLVDSEGRMLPIHFLTEQELGCEERLLSEYCHCHITRVGTLTAIQEVTEQQQPALLVQLVDQWLDRFRRMDKRREVATCTYDSDS